MFALFELWPTFCCQGGYPTTVLESRDTNSNSDTFAELEKVKSLNSISKKVD